MSAPDWDFYRSFRAVMTEGSLSGAARALALTQPTIGRHVDALERSLGVPLFTRSPQGLSPTEAAIELLPHVEAMAAAAEAVLRRASGEAQEARGTVRVTASEVMGGLVLPPILAAFRRDQPGIAIELALSNRNEDLLRREADIAVRMADPTQEALVARRVGRVRIGLYAHRAYVARHGAPRDLDELARHKMIGFDRDPQMERLMRASGLPFDRDLFALRTDSDLAAIQALRAGFGIGACQHAIAGADPDLVPLLGGRDLFAFPIWLVMHEDLRHSLRVRLLYDHLAEALAAYAAGASR